MKPVEPVLPRDATDWACDWAGAARFQRRYFKALPIAEKLQAVEDLCDVVAWFQAHRQTLRTPRCITS